MRLIVSVTLFLFPLFLCSLFWCAAPLLSSSRVWKGTVLSFSFSRCALPFFEKRQLSILDRFCDIFCVLAASPVTLHSRQNGRSKTFYFFSKKQKFWFHRQKETGTEQYILTLPCCIYKFMAMQLHKISFLSCPLAFLPSMPQPFLGKSFTCINFFLTS